VATILALTSCPMEGCHVIIFISQNPNPNFLFSFHHHGSRRRTSSPRRPPLHHHHTIAGDAPATTAPTTRRAPAAPSPQPSSPFAQLQRASATPPFTFSAPCASSFTRHHCSAVHATMSENEPWQPPHSSEKKHLAGAAAPSQGREKSERVKP